MLTVPIGKDSISCLDFLKPPIPFKGSLGPSSFVFTTKLHWTRNEICEEGKKAKKMRENRKLGEKYGRGTKDPT